MTNTSKSIYVLATWLIIMIVIVIQKNITGNINVEIEDLRYYASILSFFSLVSGIFAGIAVKRKEGGFASSLLTINIGIFIVTFWIGVVSKLLQIPLFG